MYLNAEPADGQSVKTHEVAVVPHGVTSTQAYYYCTRVNTKSNIPFSLYPMLAELRKNQNKYE
jgi:hypothetical protein